MSGKERGRVRMHSLWVHHLAGGAEVATEKTCPKREWKAVNRNNTLLIVVTAIEGGERTAGHAMTYWLRKSLRVWG